MARCKQNDLSLILFCRTLIFAYPYHLRAELLGAATQKVKPRRVAASEAGAERVSNPRLSAKYFAQPWWAPSRISALGDRNTFSRREKEDAPDRCCNLERKL